MNAPPAPSPEPVEKHPVYCRCKRRLYYAVAADGQDHTGLRVYIKCSRCQRINVIAHGDPPTIIATFN